MTIQLEFGQAGKRYQRGWALRHCDVRINPSSITALVRANGAGQSTLMAAAAGLISLTEGVSTVDGRPVDERMDAGGAGQAVVPPLAGVRHAGPDSGSELDVG